MLQNFRKKLNSVIQNIEISIPENLATQVRNVNVHAPSSIFGLPVGVPSSFLYQKEDAYTSSSVRHQSEGASRVPRSVNLEAGFQLLDRNQEIWHSIRCKNEKNARMAADLDEKITECMNTSAHRLTSITDLNITLAILPSIVDQLKTCTEMIEEIDSSMGDVEGKLMQLEDLVDVLNLQEKQLDRRFEMAMLKDKKMAELDVVREKLSQEHSQNVVKHEQAMKKVQQERQLVFQDAFLDDIKYYRETGNVPEIVTKSPSSNSGDGGHELTLEEVVLDDVDATQDLKDFLDK